MFLWNTIFLKKDAFVLFFGVWNDDQSDKLFRGNKFWEVFCEQYRSNIIFIIFVLFFWIKTGKDDKNLIENKEISNPKRMYVSK